MLFELMIVLIIAGILSVYDHYKKGE